MKGYERNRIHPTAVVSDLAQIGHDVTIGAYTVVYDNVELGDRSSISPRVTLGEPTPEFYADGHYDNPCLSIGWGAIIRSGTVIYAGCEIGPGLETGHNVVIREGTVIGEYTRLNTAVELLGHCHIGSFVHLYKGVVIAPRTHIGDFVWLFPYVGIGDDLYPPSNDLAPCTVEDYAVVGAYSVLFPGIRVGRHAVVGARTRVSTNVPPGMILYEKAETRTAEAEKLRSRKSGKPVYPWPYRFSRDMPWEEAGYEAWNRAEPNGRGSCTDNSKAG